MFEQIKEIATRLKELREISGLSIENLAEEFNISVDTYKEYESGNTDIPVSFLYSISNKLNVELTAILTGEDPKLHEYSLVRKDKGVIVDRRKNYNYQNLAYNFAQKKAEPFLVTIEPDRLNTPIDFNSHRGQEFNYVIEGSLKIIINDKELFLNEGDSIFFNSELNHGMKALNNQKVIFLAIIL